MLDASLISFSAMTDRLLRGGVAPRHVRRTIAELQDHFVDLHTEAMARGLSAVEAEADARSRLGKEDDLVQEVLNKPELRSWASRWPWLIYGLGPMLVMSVAVVSSLLFFAGGMTAAKIVTGARYIPPVWTQDLIGGVFFSVVHLLPLLIAAMVCREAVLRRTALVWPFTGVAFLCIIAAAFDIGGTWPATPEAEGVLELGFAYAAPVPLPVENYLRAGLNLSFATAFLFWYRSRQGA